MSKICDLCNTYRKDAQFDLTKPIDVEFICNCPSCRDVTHRKSVIVCRSCLKTIKRSGILEKSNAKQSKLN